MNPQALEKYKNVQFSTPHLTGKMLFVIDEVLKMLYVAQKAVSQKDYELKYNTILKIVDVIVTLRSGINASSASQELLILDNLYVSAIDELNEINVNSTDPKDFDTIIGAFKQIRDSIEASDAKE